MTSPLFVFVASVLLLLRSSTTQAAQCARDGSSQLRFVAQLSVSGCTLTVHDTGASDGPHLAVEPIMCVTESLHNVTPRYDPITKQNYMSVPVTLRDDSMLEEVQRQLRDLSPKSVKFASVSNISVSVSASSKFQAMGFVWSPEDPVGFMLLSCKLHGNFCSLCILASELGASQFEALEQAVLAAKIVSNGTLHQLRYPLIVPKGGFTNPDSYTGFPPECKQLRFVRSIRLTNCTARVHRRLDKNGHFLIEPLLCHNITSMSNESVIYDYSRDMFYLKLDVVLQDDKAVDTVRTQLADLSPLSVTFMRLWRAQSHVAPALSRRFEIGPLMVSGDERSAQVRVYCVNRLECSILRSAVSDSPMNLWMHVQYWLTNLVSNRCILKSDFPKNPWPVQESIKMVALPGCKISDPIRQESKISDPIRHESKIFFTPDGRRFIKIQQRLTGDVSFQRTWAEYEQGFGDDKNFWIGLKTINSLTGSSPRLLRVEAITWSGKLYVCEYFGFSVGDASTAYTMTFGSYLAGTSNTTQDSLGYNRGNKFSTLDKDNDRDIGDCSNTRNGRGGWWYKDCSLSNPNGIYRASAVANVEHNMFWFGADSTNALQRILMMVQM